LSYGNFLLLNTYAGNILRELARFARFECTGSKIPRREAIPPMDDHHSCTLVAGVMRCECIPVGAELSRRACLV